MLPELVYQIALNEVPNIGDVLAKSLIQIFGSASEIFKAPVSQLEKIEGVGTIRAKSIKHFRDFDACAGEIPFLEKHKITPIFITDATYPKRLLQCADSPSLLYYKGVGDLNVPKIISVVGTRNNSDYGRQVTEELIAGLEHSGIMVISGLAYGIDTISHKAALKNNLQTVAVVAHGLDRIYPPNNTSLAKDIIKQGGLLTEFRKGIGPDKQNFPLRNRIVAGMCDALIVVESGLKGGSLITAELANGYNKDVFAIPGRTTDSRSEGCNYAIRNNKASLLTSAEELLQMMNWVEAAPKPKRQQRQLFIEFTVSEKIVYDILQTKEQVHIDELFLNSKMSSSSVASALLTLEMQNVVACMPGKMYRLL